MHRWCGKVECRPGRPLCAKQRAKTLKYQPCDCVGYHYPHRRGSGQCIHHPDGERRQFEAFTGESWDGAA